MIRAGMKLRAGCLALRIRWVEQVEQERDDALEARDDARLARSCVEHQVEALEVQLTAIDGQLARRGFTPAHDQAAAVRALIDSLDDEALYGDVIGDIAEVLGMAGAPQRWNTRDIMTRLKEVMADARIRREAEREQRAANRELSAVREWCVGILGDGNGAWAYPLVDVVRRASAAQATVASAEQLPREAFDPAMGGDIEPPPGRCPVGQPHELSTLRGNHAELHRAVADKLHERGLVDDESDAGIGVREALTALHDVLADDPWALFGRSAPQSELSGSTVDDWQAQKLAEAALPEKVVTALEVADRAWTPPDGTGERGGSYARQMAALAALASAVRGAVASERTTRAVLAPDVDTTGTPLDVLARASIDSNRVQAVAAELRWWSWGRIVRSTELLARADDLVAAPTPWSVGERDALPPRPDVWGADREVEVPF